ncbi:TetR/AcrR family transcriptional regulator [Lactonifactor longoviformis]|uniref:HTH tetR-type domain-containing protein n=1 Tax=Lactonifactor longoviformis DSM 17459 TaxID=1122155 RepID=A0A1M4YHU3_9CLOT|nr:TetR/AcrR family transcriptional regulator [Lactonifactor longoviformis]POP32963.1 TetR/AcrR family transcriptional regulator [Lactonifactor longoviformis]SHF05299.1 hypothetical protein SAMN02745158_02391 [Lactonifactor longoviformis DSM 17459]
MAVYSKGIETKKRFILSTYNKLLVQDSSEISVRKLAKENGCSVAALYKHFDSLEYLIAVASVRFLDEYMVNYGKLLDSGKNLLEIYIEGWELFDHYAFQRPDVYYRLFWGARNSVFGNAVQDYFELFPISGSEEYTAHYFTLLFDGDMRKRDFIILRRIENMKLISDEEAEYFSWTNPLIVKGMLESAIDEESAKCAELELRCNRLIRKNMQQVFERVK